MNKRPDWDQFYITMCYLVAQRSKDLSTHAGCVIVGADNTIRSIGYNDLPRKIDYQGEIGVDGVPSRQSRIDGEKYLWFEHAERNSIYNAGRNGVSLLGCKLYINWIPCADCARAIIQSGISHVIIHKEGQEAFLHSRNEIDNNVWEASHNMVLDMLIEAGVCVDLFSGSLSVDIECLFTHKLYKFDPETGQPIMCGRKDV